MLLSISSFLISFFIADYFATSWLKDNFMPFLSPDSEMNLYYGYHPVLGFSGLSSIEAPHFDKTVVHNSFGFRSEEITASKPPGVKRLVITGDSQAWGFGLAQDETISSQLTEILNSDKEDQWEVLNLGTCGYSTTQGILSFYSLAWDKDPDVWIHIQFPNDCLDNEADYDLRWIPMPALDIDGSGELIISNVPIPRLNSFYDKDIYNNLIDYINGKKYLIFKICFDFFKYRFQSYSKVADLHSIEELAAYFELPGLMAEMNPISIMMSGNYQKSKRDGSTISRELIHKQAINCQMSGMPFLPVFVPDLHTFPKENSCNNAVISSLEQDRLVYLRLRTELYDSLITKNRIFNGDGKDSHLSPESCALTAALIYEQMKLSWPELINPRQDASSE